MTRNATILTSALLVTALMASSASARKRGRSHSKKKSSSQSTNFQSQGSSSSSAFQNSGHKHKHKKFFRHAKLWYYPPVYYPPVYVGPPAVVVLPKFCAPLIGPPPIGPPPIGPAPVGPPATGAPPIGPPATGPAPAGPPAAGVQTTTVATALPAGQTAPAAATAPASAAAATSTAAPKSDAAAPKPPVDAAGQKTVDTSKLRKIPAGGTTTINGKTFGIKKGTAVVQIGQLALPVQVGTWKGTAVTITLPRIGVAKGMPAKLFLVNADGKVAGVIDFLLVAPKAAEATAQAATNNGSVAQTQK